MVKDRFRLKVGDTQSKSTSSALGLVQASNRKNGTKRNQNNNFQQKKKKRIIIMFYNFCWGEKKGESQERRKATKT